MIPKTLTIKTAKSNNFNKKKLFVAISKTFYKLPILASNKTKNQKMQV